jgi:hypothetical protein
MPIQFINQSKNATVQEAAAVVQAEYKNEEFLNLVEKHGFFLFPQVQGTQIARKMRADDSQITLILKNCTEPDCPTKASTSLENKRISLHSHTLENPNLSRDQVIETLMHEYIHTLGYKHVGNKRNWINKKTAPYKVASLFVEFLKQKKEMR